MSARQALKIVTTGATNQDPGHAAEEQVTEQVRVLVVEDNDSERWRIAAMLGKLGYVVLEASNGDEALSLQLQENADLVLSDWKMPIMDGLEMCRILKQEADYGAPYFIMLTGMKNPVDLIAGMESGADDFIAKPCVAEELRVRIQAGARVQRVRREQERLNNLLRQLIIRDRRAARRIREDLETGAALQQSLLPCENARFDSFCVSTLSQAAGAVSGDFLNYFRIGPHHLAFYLLDVSGQSVGAAMLSFSIAYQLSTGSRGGSIVVQEQDGEEVPRKPSEVVQALNAKFQGSEHADRHFTMVYGVVDLRDGSGKLCQAGHPHPLLLSGDGSVYAVGDGGFPVGLSAHSQFNDIQFCLKRGERLIVCSDGLLEALARGAPGDSLVQILGTETAGTADGMIDEIRSSLERSPGGNAVDDDISALAISRDSS